MMGDLPCEEDISRAETAVEFEHVVLLGLPEFPGLPGPPVSTFPRLMFTLLYAPPSEPLLRTEEPVSAAKMLILVCGMFLSVRGDESIAERLQRYSLLS